MNPSVVLTSETLELLDRMRSFVVEPCRRPPSVGGHHPAFENVIRPLLALADEAYVWSPRSKKRSMAYPMEILLPERGRFRFDLSKEVIEGHELFWTASAHSRGSIAIRLPHLPKDMERLFGYCSRLAGCDEPAILASRYQLAQSDSPGAIRYCDSAIDCGQFAFLFSASNGIQILSIFAPRSELVKLYQLASIHCPAYQRWTRNEPSSLERGATG